MSNEVHYQLVGHLAVIVQNTQTPQIFVKNSSKETGFENVSHNTSSVPIHEFEGKE